MTFNDLDASPYHHWLYDIRRRERWNKGMGYNMSIRIWKNNADDAIMSDHIEPGDSNHLYEFRTGLRGLTRFDRNSDLKYGISDSRRVSEILHHEKLSPSKPRNLTTTRVF